MTVSREIFSLYLIFYINLFLYYFNVKSATLIIHFIIKLLIKRKRKENGASKYIYNVFQNVTAAFFYSVGQIIIIVTYLQYKYWQYCQTTRKSKMQKLCGTYFSHHKDRSPISTTKTQTPLSSMLVRTLQQQKKVSPEKLISLFLSAAPAERTYGNSAYLEKKLTE